MVVACCDALMTPEDEERNTAIKKIRFGKTSLGEGKRVTREIRLLRTLHHPNIIGLKQVLFDPPENETENPLAFSHIYLVLDLMDTTLHRVIQSQNLTAEHRRFITYQLVCGIHFIHSAGLLFIFYSSSLLCS